MARYAFLVLLLCPLSAFGQQDPIEIHNGFLTGEEYLNSSEVKQRGYAMGFVDGLFIAPTYGAPKTRMAPIERCVERMTDTQVAAIFTKYLRENPGRWHQSAHVAFYVALKDNCGLK